MRGKTGFCLLVFLLSFLFATTSFADTPKVLRVSAIPDEVPSELQRIYQPIAKYLEERVGIPVNFVPVTDYAATVEGLVAGKLDMVWYGGFTHVLARIKSNGTSYAIAMRQEDAEFHSKFIANVNSGINSLADLKGRNFSFGGVGSTSGHLMPWYYLLQNGINPQKDFKKFSFSGNHDATAKVVESGSVEAGALNESIWAKLVETKKVDTNKVKVIWTTPAYVDYNWTVRGDLDKNLVEKLRAAFVRLDYNNPNDRKLLDLHRTKRYIPVTSESIFEGIEKAGLASGLIK